MTSMGFGQGGFFREFNVGMASIASRYIAAVQALRGKQLRDTLMQAGQIVQGEVQRILTRPRKSKFPPAPAAPWMKKSRSTAQTFRLRQSISARWVSPAGVSVGTNLAYAMIQEFGGKTRPHLIRPKGGLAYRTKKGGLAFYWHAKGRWSVLPFVRHPGSQIDPNPYLIPGFENKRDEVFHRIRRAWGGKIFIGGELAT